MSTQFNFGPAKQQISPFTGATASTNGDSGLVPAPSSGDQDKYLKGDGTWGTVSSGGALPSVTSSDNGKVLEVVNGEWNTGTEKANKTDTVLDTTLSRGRKVNTTVGTGSFAFGNDATASGQYSHAEGASTVASADRAHAEGAATQALGVQSHAEGTTTKATGVSSHAEGNSAIASAQGSHAEGSSTTASGDYSHAEGSSTTASGAQSHTEGAGTTASAYNSHAEGAGTTASGSSAHSEGNGTTASGNQSHAEGMSTIAAGVSSHAGGEFNIADSYDNWNEWVANTSYAVGDKVKVTTTNNNVTTVVGYICKTANSDSTFTYSNWTNQYGKMNFAEIIGNGTSSERSNARALDWDGNEYLKGDLYVGCDSDSTNGSKVAKVSELPGVMTGATSSANGTSGLVPAPTTTDVDKFLAGDGTFKSGGKPMVILSYGNSTWAEFESAYNSNVIVYCRASSNSNPATGSQTRMAFMAYVNNATTPTEVEFQYYRSVSSHTASQQGDQVFVYKLTKTGGWTVTTREASVKVIAGTNITGTYSSGTMTISGNYSAFTGATSSATGVAGLVPAPVSGDQNKYLKGDGTWDNVDALPVVTSSDNGKILEVNNGEWAIGNEKIDKKYNNDGYAWSTKTWTGLTDIDGSHIWTDGESIYYYDYSNDYILNKNTSTWSIKAFDGLTHILGTYIWSDGENTYYSNGSNQYVLDKSTSTWSAKEWTGLTSFTGGNIWFDGNDIYYSSGSTHYVLNKSTSTWSVKSWNGLSSFDGIYIWTDGNNIYYSNGWMQYILNISTSTWSVKSWNGFTNITASHVWTDGENIYYSSGTSQYVLDKSTSTWSTKTWTGLTSFYGNGIWTDGNYIYYNGTYKYGAVYNIKLLLGTDGEFSPVAASDYILPEVTIADNGKVLQVYNGSWVAATIPNASGVSF